VKRYVKALAPQCEANPSGSSWHLGYQLILLGEYYLKTGDRTVIPAMTTLADKTADGQIAGSWGHYMNDTSVGYVQSGQMNSAGVTVFLGLCIARECGITSSEQTFQRALKFFYRMPGHGSICYGDHRSEIYIDTNGRNAAIACAMGILQDDACNKAAEHMAMLVVDSYCEPEAGHTGGGFNVIWRGIGTMFLPDDQQDRHRRHMDELDWFYTLCRLPDGGFKIMPSAPGGATRYTGEDWGYSVGLTYTAPRRNLRMLGGEPTKHSVKRSLPKRIWGAERDLDFFRTDYCEGYGKEVDPPDVIYDKVHKDRNASPSVEYLAKQMRHFSPMFRTWAAQKLVKYKNEEAYKAIEEALQHPDVRVRRASCDAISSYTNWGRRHSQVIPREVVSKRFVPHIEKMLRDPQA
ncbi:MAG: HEAT repeat domain-containing protein, partial [Rhodospirillales bacterium]|nr:HEAT repeat domain-containing protein [Rhodospirillales bacterium]